ncbi:MAG TPA: 2-dehydro-3-deoxygalactonokinase, partial [Paracoccaceae bacterium]|nr:2-dehydro-3-deoxygalactonokinase [Paracoccaceae bacterium]
MATKASACLPGNSKTETKAEWIAIDWGTSNLRVWHMDADGNVLESRSSDRGMGSLSPAEFEGALLEL